MDDSKLVMNSRSFNTDYNSDWEASQKPISITDYRMEVVSLNFPHPFTVILQGMRTLSVIYYIYNFLDRAPAQHYSTDTLVLFEIADLPS
jgi:hypothetical protein